MSGFFSSLIDRFGIAGFASDVGVSYGAAKQMRRRDSIAPEYWAAVIAAAQYRGWHDVSAESLVHAATTNALADAEHAA
jgi:hypothetical protein